MAKHSFKETCRIYRSASLGAPAEWIEVPVAVVIDTHAIATYIGAKAYRNSGKVAREIKGAVTVWVESPTTL